MGADTALSFYVLSCGVNQGVGRGPGPGTSICKLMPLLTARGQCAPKKTHQFWAEFEILGVYLEIFLDLLKFQNTCSCLFLKSIGNAGGDKVRAAAKKCKERPRVVTYWDRWMTRRARITVRPWLSGGASEDVASWDPLKVLEWMQTGFHRDVESQVWGGGGGRYSFSRLSGLYQVFQFAPTLTLWPFGRGKILDERSCSSLFQTDT